MPLLTRFGAVLLVCLLSAACERISEAGGGKATPKAEDDVADTSRPIEAVFPRATSAKMFVKGSKRRPGSEWDYEDVWLNPPNGYELKPGQIEGLRKALQDQPVPEALAACFVPHHFFRFYDETGRQVGEVSICFCCVGAASEPALVRVQDRMLGADFASIAKLVKELGAPTNVDCGEDEDWFK